VHVRITRLVRFSLLVLVLLTAERAFAQEPERRGFIGLGIGPSTPFGSFNQSSWANTRTDGTAPGYTDTFVNLGYRMRQHWGVAGAFSYSEFVMTGDGDDDWWQVSGLTAGPMYTLGLGPRAALDLKAMAGLITMLPVVDSRGSENDRGSGLAIDLRAAVRYDVLRRWAIFAEGGIQAANVSSSSGGRTGYRALISGLGVAFRPAW
jgi:Outer membrane protein beta-barrel domain